MRHLNCSVMIAMVGQAFYIFVTLLAINTSTSSIAIAKSMTDNEYQFLESSIEAEYRTAKTRCTPLLGDANKQCLAQAKVIKNKANSELEIIRKEDVSTQSSPRIAKADSEYLVAMHHCNSKTSSNKILCEKNAKSVWDKEIKNAKKLMRMEIPTIEQLQDDHQSNLNSMKIMNQLPSSFAKSRSM